MSYSTANQGSNAREAPVQQARRGRAPFSRRGLFSKDLAPMMYSFGDVFDPQTDTVQVMEDLLTDYITDLCVTAHGVSTNRGKLKLDDVRFALRKPHHGKQLARVEELLIMDQELKKARNIGEENLADYAREDFGASDGGEEGTSGQSPSKKQKKNDKTKR